MKAPRLQPQELYLLGLLLAECDEHIGTVFNLAELETESFSRRQARFAADSLDVLGLVSLSSISMPGSRRSDDMLMLTPLGIAYCLREEAAVLNAMLDGGSIEHTQRVREAYDRLRLEDEGAQVSLEGLDATSAIPASDRIVDLTDNQRALDEAVEKITEAADAIRSANGPNPSDKSFWLDQIELGLAVLKKPRVYITAIVSLTIAPLYSAYTSVAEEWAKPIIASAIQAVRHLIGF